jgi:dGTPase
MNGNDPCFFERRLHGTGEPRSGDTRCPYERDRARLLHSAAFRRLQGKTQVMGAGEGDFHRTRLTHSIECAQVGYGLLGIVTNKTDPSSPLQPWLPSRDLIEAACFAHDLGHPPFGHRGERALHRHMAQCGGFEGNGQTLRIVTKLEKYRQKGWGIDPTRRLVLAILKYPCPYSAFGSIKYNAKPPKCYFDEEQEIVTWACEGFSSEDITNFRRLDSSGKASNRTFDSSLMELADDIAYGVHDIEDIVAREAAKKEEIADEIKQSFRKVDGSIECHGDIIGPCEVIDGLFESSYMRKQMIAKLVNLFIVSVELQSVDGFSHPLLAFRAALPLKHRTLLSELKELSYRLVIQKAQMQQLEQRGQRIVEKIFVAMKDDPHSLIPDWSWTDADETVCPMRRVTDYVAGMTDAYAEKVYRRLFIPGWGSSTDEL